ncbi:MAG: YgfZ/GcvT domain-containing protein [Chloroflexota bacterium]
MFYFLPDTPGFLSLDGEGALDFLQRQTSNDLLPLAPGRVIQTVLTSPTGRILDVLTVFNRGASLGLITLPGRAPATQRFLRSRIFFMDRVTVSDERANWLQVDVYDARLLAQLNLPLPQRGEICRAEAGWVLAHGGLLEDGFRILAPADGALLDRLATMGAGALSPQAHEIRRIERGYPAHRVELAEAYTPLEVGLHALVAENKGCYTGQEVLARQINYGKISRHLAGVALADAVSVGAEVLVDARPVGEITSFAVSPRFGPLALAVLRRPHHEPGTQVTVGVLAGRVVALPAGRE